MLLVSYDLCHVEYSKVFFIFRPTFCRGDHTHEIPMELFKQNRTRLCERLKATEKVPAKSYVLLQGGVADTRNDTDHEPLFRQVNLFTFI